MSFNPFKILEDFGIPTIGLVIASFFVLLGIVYYWTPAEMTFTPAARLLLLSAPIWVPIILSVTFWKIWLEYIRAKFISSQKHVLLEIKLPREVVRSPQAMETLLTNLHIGMGEGTFINRYIEGRVRPWYSLEIASLGGRIHFFIWTRAFLRDVVEAQIYGQYPMVEVHEVEDYAQKLGYHPDRYGLWGCDFKLTGKDAYPIKTYIDYGLDKDPKEEYKIDPMAGFFEFLSHIGPDEQIWFQLMIRMNKDKLREDRKYKKGVFFVETTSWKDEAKEEIEKIREESRPETSGDFPGFPNPTPGQTDKIKALERSVSKLGFDAGMRGIYIAKKDAFNPSNIAALTSSLKQLNASDRNGIAPTRWFTEFGYPWQDIFGKKQENYRKWIIDAYRRRSWFHEPYKTPWFVFNTEEIATIFHFPGSVVQAPTLERISSTKGEAPPNLPG
ncbi:MAG: hypothetical protein OQJ98_01995 [Candidatus Pacebacteria bacterium]|nr:hypothetical protein [Candidatus Paceibacterota bacterium]